MKNLNFRKHWFITVILGGLAMVIFSFTNLNDDWDIPAEYQKKTSPIASDDESIDIGETIYAKYCKSCHGKYGEGDGSKAAELETSCGDFTLEEFQSQSDGPLFYKIWVGRDEMPGFEKKIPDQEDIWHLINFVRTMGE